MAEEIDHKAILKKAKELPQEDHKFELGDDKEVQPDLLNVVEPQAENPPIEGMPNTPQVNHDFLSKFTPNDYSKPLIHPNAIKKLGDSRPLISFVGRSIVTTDKNRGKVPLTVRCTVEEMDTISNRNFYGLFPFKNGDAPYTVKGGMFIINNFPYLVLRYEMDSYKRYLVERKKERKKRTKRRKDFLEQTREEAKKEFKEEMQKEFMEEIQKERNKEKVKPDIEDEVDWV